MKQIVIIILISFSLFSCNGPGVRSSEIKKDIEIVKEDFAWIPGKWIRVNDKDGMQTFENWERKNESEYHGFSYTLKDIDTVWQEQIKLIKTNDHWSFDVWGKGDIEPTKFGVTFLDENKFICENQANEFPKIIGYLFAGDTLHAKISGPGMEVLFDFIKAD